jgi:hypothetical protein
MFGRKDHVQRHQLKVHGRAGAGGAVVAVEDTFVRPGLVDLLATVGVVAPAVVPHTAAAAPPSDGASMALDVAVVAPQAAWTQGCHDQEGGGHVFASSSAAAPTPADATTPVSQTAAPVSVDAQVMDAAVATMATMASASAAPVAAAAPLNYDTDCSVARVLRRQRARATAEHVCHADGCGAVFHKKSQLRRHAFEHTGVKPYVCPHGDCGK